MGYHPMLTETANFVTNALRRDFYLVMCGPDAAFTSVVCTSGLEIEFYPNFTPERAH